LQALLKRRRQLWSLCYLHYTCQENGKKKTAVSKQSGQYYKNQRLEVTSEILNAREGAGKNYDIIETLHQGDILTFLSYNGEWIYVKINNSSAHGYIYYKYVKISKY
jgi:uncharacterized protein YgiM (DUF1202 family)